MTIGSDWCLHWAASRCEVNRSFQKKGSLLYSTSVPWINKSIDLCTVIKYWAGGRFPAASTWQELGCWAVNHNYVIWSRHKLCSNSVCVAQHFTCCFLYPVWPSARLFYIKQKDEKKEVNSHCSHLQPSTSPCQSAASQSTSLPPSLHPSIHRSTPPDPGPAPALNKDLTSPNRLSAKIRSAL